MKDHFGRNINYLRLSITDRCNLRCKYCMPHGVEFTPHEQILTYEEFLRVARAAVHLGIPRFKITGGEPLVRKGVTDFIAALKRLPGVEEVTLTTNGVRLAELVPALKAAGVDGVNISLDAADPETFQAITGFDQLGNVLAGLDASLAAGLHTKINFVLLAGCEGRVLPVAKLAQSRPVDVRFIEVMPIGAGAESRGLSPAEARKLLLAQWPDLHPVDEHRGNGPAHYDASARLLGRDDIGQLAGGKGADLFMIDSRRLELVGSCFDPKSVLGTVGVRGPVDYTVIHGRVTVAQGHLMTVDEERLAQEAETCCRQYLAR